MDSPWFNEFEERDQEWSMTSSSSWEDAYWSALQREASACDELEKVCRGFTDLVDTIREVDRDLYDQVVKPMIEGDNDPRPEWWLENEYCPRTI